MPIRVERRPGQWPPCAKSAQIGEQSSRLSIGCLPTALIEGDCEELHGIRRVCTLSQFGQLPNRSRNHLHAILFSPDSPEILGMLAEDQDQASICSMRVLFQGLQNLDRESNQDVPQFCVLLMTLGQPWKTPGMFPGAHGGRPPAVRSPHSTPCRAGWCDQHDVIVPACQLVQQPLLKRPVS